MVVYLEPMIGENKIVVLVMPNEKYAEDMIEISKNLSGRYKRPCYVSLNRPYSALIKTLEHKNIDTKRFFSIDGITRTASGKADEIENCVFVNAPNALTELSLSITELFKTWKPDLLLFDCLSTILIYEKVETVLKFMHSLIARTKVSGCTAIFTALDGNVETDLINDLNPFVDKVILL